MALTEMQGPRRERGKAADIDDDSTNPLSFPRPATASDLKDQSTETLKSKEEESRWLKDETK